MIGGSHIGQDRCRNIHHPRNLPVGSTAVRDETGESSALVHEVIA